MKVTFSSAAQKPQTFTGDARLWPDGFYRTTINGVGYDLVHISGGVITVYAKDGEHSQPYITNYPVFGYTYRPVPPGEKVTIEFTV